MNKNYLIPKEIVSELDKFIVGQNDAKKVVANSIRYRWRRKSAKQFKSEIVPKNVLMVGPTGVGKTEIARRVAKIYNAPFVKVEATKFTEVGYVGRDVESIIRDLMDVSINIVKKEMYKEVENNVKESAKLKVIKALVGENSSPETLERLKKDLESGMLDDTEIEIEVKDSGDNNHAMDMMPGMGVGMINIGEMIGKVIGNKKKKIKVTVADSYALLMEDEYEDAIDNNKAVRKAKELIENEGIVFIDEVDKLVTSSNSSSKDVSREGVQRDLLPLIEGTLVQTKYGNIKTDHILFIASGAFYNAKPSELLPELQGRLPVRVELVSLTESDFTKILLDPEASLTKQYIELFKTENIKLSFADSAIKEIARIAFYINQHVENIGARRLHTLMEKLLEDLSFNCEENKDKSLKIDKKYVNEKLDNVIKDIDLSKFIL